MFFLVKHFVNFISVKGAILNKRIIIILLFYLEGAGLQQADLVVLTQISETRDLLSELHHLPDGGGETVREILPNLVSRLVRVHVRRSVHRTHLRREERGREDIQLCSF